MKRATKLGLLVVVAATLSGLASASQPAPALAEDEVPSPAVVAAEPAAQPAETMSCPEGMVEVEGSYCPSVEQTCVRWVDATKTRCAEFAPTGNCQGETVQKRFCIDRFEYPNKAGEMPVTMKSWEDAQRACNAQGKRLCGDSEWTLACEGSERRPYPYGHTRDAKACNIDKPHKDADMNAYANPKTRAAETARLWQAEPSGSRPGCQSEAGVFDMTGNVDEWVVNETGAPHQSGLKGGHWGPVRNRCRPMTTSHDEGFSFYQIGFRCCADAAQAS